HVALVVAPGELSLYLDGRPVGTTAAVDATISELGTDLKAYLGRSFYQPDAYFDGAFDDIRIWDTALPPEELLADGLVQVQDTDQVLSQKVRTQDDKRILDVTLDYWAPGGNVSGEVTDVPARCPDRKSTRLNSSHVSISYAVFCLKKKK